MSDFRRGVAAELRRLGPELKWSSAESKASRYAMCNRAGIEVVYDCIHAGEGKHYVPLPCDLRTCPECARRRQGAVAEKYAEILHGEVMALPREKRKGKRWRMVTLTRWNPGGYDPERLRRQVLSTRRYAVELWRSFWGSYRQERRTAADAGVGAVMGLEISPPDGRGAGGMVHAHLLVYGEYVPQAEIAERWKAITGDSYIVDIREVRNPLHLDPLETIRDAVKETLKYAAKPIEATSAEHLRCIAAIEYALHGTRRLAAYGIFYGKVKEYSLEEVEEEGLSCPTCGCEAHAGRIRGPEHMRAEFRAGACWHPQYDPSRPPDPGDPP